MSIASEQNDRMKVSNPILLACLLLAGCASLTATPYQAPALALPAQWQTSAQRRPALRQQGTGGNSLAMPNWMR
jgi:outer membrane biogenesis lipoprotein LolB